MPKYYDRSKGTPYWGDNSVLMVREDGSRDYIDIVSRNVIARDHEAAVRWTDTIIADYPLKEVQLIDPDLEVDEGL